MSTWTFKWDIGLREGDLRYGPSKTVCSAWDFWHCDTKVGMLCLIFLYFRGRLPDCNVLLGKTCISHNAPLLISILIKWVAGGSITSRCSRKEPVLLRSTFLRSQGRMQTGLEGAAEIEPRVLTNC